MKVNDIGSKVAGLLQGEPLRAIVYGAAVVVWIVAGISGNIPDISIDSALVQATAAGAFLTELSRRFVYSPPTVERIAENAATTGVPEVPAPPAGDPQDT